jgi:hypothetical protein
MTKNTKKKRKRFMMIDPLKKEEKEALVIRKRSPISNNWSIK